MRMTTSDRQFHVPCTAPWMLGLLIGLPFLEGCAPSAATLAVTEACEADDVPALRQLVATGAHRKRIQIGDEPIGDSWMYPIHAAAQYGSAEALKVFLAAGCDPNQRDSDDKTPLMYLLEGEAGDDATILQCIGILRESGADVNCASKHGNTALHFAAMYHSRQIVARLFECGADVDAVDHVGKTPLDICKENPKCDFVELLQKQMPLK